MSFDTDDELTPVPVAPPEPAPEARRRIAAVTQSPSLSPRETTVKIAIAEMSHQMDEQREALTQVISLLQRRNAGEVLKEAAESSSALRTAAERVGEVVTRQDQLATLVGQYRQHGPGAAEAREALGVVRALSDKLYGSDLDDADTGDIGKLKADTGAALKRSVRFFAAALGALGAAAGAIVLAAMASASDSGSLRTQVKANEAMIQLQQIQLQNITTFLYGGRSGLPSIVPIPGGPP